MWRGSIYFIISVQINQNFEGLLAQTPGDAETDIFIGKGSKTIDRKWCAQSEVHSFAFNSQPIQNKLSYENVNRVHRIDSLFDFK